MLLERGASGNKSVKNPRKPAKNDKLRLVGGLIASVTLGDFIGCASCSDAGAGMPRILTSRPGAQDSAPRNRTFTMNQKKRIPKTPAQKLRITLSSYSNAITIKAIARAERISRQLIYDWRRCLEREALFIFARGGGSKKIRQLERQRDHLLGLNLELDSRLAGDDSRDPSDPDEDDV